ncbi:hypothetical protein SAMN02910369_00572 [Lachnospiraceae bacterium NE2001]|nr:hypothetical protein SAMN02910369_00572 [Lachnospiraceae bacterium NE2001]
MSEIQELEAKLVQSQKKLNDLQYEVNAIHMELLKLKDEEKAAGRVVEEQQRQESVQTEQAPRQYVSPYRQQQVQPVQPGVQQQVQPVQPGVQPQIQPAQQGVQPQPAQQGRPDAQPIVQPSVQQTQVPAYQPQPKYWESQMPGYKGPKTVPYWGAKAANGINAPADNVKPPRDTEWLVGIRGMGIVASILVFISFILFAMYLIPGLTDEIKMALMFIISSGLTAVGLFFWLRKKESLFFLSLGACGIGALYISLFVSNIYFHKIDQIPLYILLLIWAAGVLYLSRIKPLLFEIIGLSGIVISVFLGTIFCVKDNDSLLLGILAIYLVVGVMAFMMLKLRDNVSLVISSVAACLGNLIILVGAFDLNDDPAFPCIVLVLFSMTLIVLDLILIDEDRYEYLPIFGAINTLVLEFAIKAAIPDKDFSTILVLIISVILYIGVEMYHKMELTSRAPLGKGKSVGVVVWEAFLLLMCTACVIGHESLGEYVGAFVLLVPLILYGFIADDNQSKISALVMYVFVAFDFALNPWAGLTYVIVAFGLFILMMVFNKNQYNDLLKLLFYIVFFIGLHAWVVAVTEQEEWDEWIVASILLFVAGAINFAAAKTMFGRNWLTGDEEKAVKVTSYIINAFLMLESVILMYDVESEGLRVFVVLTAILLFVINSWNLLKSENNLMIIYVGVKFTVLLMCILDAFGVVNYVISISVFVLATLLILLGFKLKVKSLRIYGLVTTMIFAVKLVMVDIKYDNVLGNALSFFISGLICFGISALYSIADKKLARDDASKTAQKNINWDEYNYGNQGNMNPVQANPEMNSAPDSQNSGNAF